MDANAGRWLRAGQVGRPHGLDGSFHVRRAVPRLLRAGATVLVCGRRTRIVRRAGDAHRPIVRLEAWTDRPAAETLNGQELLVDRADAPELDEDEWWADDLIGCLVYDGAREVGAVRQLIALPSCEVLEVGTNEGGELLVPLISDAVRAVDVERRRIEVDVRFLAVE